MVTQSQTDRPDQVFVNQIAVYSEANKRYYFVIKLFSFLVNEEESIFSTASNLKKFSYF